MSAVAAAFVKAGMSMDIGRLALAVDNLMTREGVQPMKALARFVETLQGDQILLRALAADYIMRYDAGIKNRSLADDDPKPHVTPQDPVVVGRSVGGGAGHCIGASAPGLLPASPPLKEDREGHNKGASAALVPPSRSSLVHGGMSPSLRADHSAIARPVVKLNPPRGPAAIASIQHVVARSILDTFRVRDGRPIGNVAWGELIVLARSNEREGRILRFIEGQRRGVDPKMKIRDALSAKIVEDAIRFATEAENAVA